ncbi:restriction endonuclease subunit S [Arthrobacter sp. SLBN-122]|uniref:restriction endonuclease subunit S n=1 Tax=Arthrobacter sp. SLBN-122 TaxID=2768455 RepID=UPI00116F6567|nr:restriction endonuclease subunit S [Arthrobacter sp. SLBN-122]TQJ36717.1 type I restriction enzyme S subunit [Arthrobacter sp. SLBN-122]
MNSVVSLKQVCQRVDYGLTTSAVLGGDGPRFLRITDIDDSFVDWASVPRCTASEAESAKYALADGDIVVARTGASTGRSQWVTVSEPSVFASYLIRFRVGPEFDSRFVAYVLSSEPWFDHVLSVAHGKSAQPNMSASEMARFRFACPPLPEQKAIAQVLGVLDDKIAANTKLAETADEVGSTLTRRWLDPDVTVVLSSIADIVMGSSPLGADLNETGAGTVFYQGVRDFGLRFPSSRVWTTAPLRLAEPGDTLLSVRAPVGRVNLAREETCIGRGLASVRSTTGQRFSLFHLLKASKEAWAPFDGGGTIFGSINKGQLASIQLPGIKQEHAGRLEDSLAALEKLVSSALGENAQLAQTRDSILPQLMSGRLRVKDAEKVLENAGA